MKTKNKFKYEGRGKYKYENQIKKIINAITQYLN